ncbi:MAG: hypothetical protein KJP21_02270, partial [Bacteroidia bacterium]|nr:hypothetical protein [Bacteroidia bacterium]
MQLEKISKLVLIVLLGITSFFSYTAFDKLEISNDFERFFPTQNNDVDFYNSYKEDFLSDNEQAIIAIKLPKGVYNLQTLKKLKKLCNELKKVTNIKSVISITELEYPVKAGFAGYASMPYVN